METRVVDPSINKLLDSDLIPPASRNIKDIEDEMFDLSEDEVDVKITDGTKNLISSVLLSSIAGSPEITIKIVNILQSLENLTEKQGQLYLKAIQASDLMQVNSQAVTMILQLSVNTFFCPEWPETEKKKVLSDKYVRAGVSNILSSVFYRLGHWSGAILFFLYCLESYNIPLIRFADYGGKKIDDSAAETSV